ncbi:hypothetical protein [Streptomyces sp. NPDC006879]|uniref:hypothetical protein n=1 Tax=Streptomyces sp. NPDC006879 TaxID=3364767 RepID=UPI0036C685CA
MRGLKDGGRPGTDEGLVRGRGSLAAVSAGAVALVGAALLVGGCASGGTGVRDEGPAHTDPVGKAAAPAPSVSHSPAYERIDAVTLVKNDPKVSSEIKRDLRPCVADEYPVDVTYGKVTANGPNDVIVNVLSCADAVGLGSYVYRANGEGYENVFADEQPPVYAEVDRGDLVLTKPVYTKSDALAYPSGEDVITYRWTGEKFTEHDRVHTDYSNAVDGGGQPAPAVTSAN